jgi:hypothetical protein
MFLNAMVAQQQQQQQRASMSSMLFLTFFFFMMSGGNGANQQIIVGDQRRTLGFSRTEKITRNRALIGSRIVSQLSKRITCKWP